MAAVGQYIRALREGQHISRTGLASQLEVDATTLWRIEEGKQEPSGSLLVNLVTAVRGSFDDIHRLLNSKSIDEDESRRVAAARLSRADLSRLAAIREEPANYSIVSLAEKVSTDPELRRAFVQIVDAIRDQEDAELQ